MQIWCWSRSNFNVFVSYPHRAKHTLNHLVVFDRKTEMSLRRNTNKNGPNLMVKLFPHNFLYYSKNYIIPAAPSHRPLSNLTARCAYLFQFLSIFCFCSQNNTKINVIWFYFIFIFLLTQTLRTFSILTVSERERERDQWIKGRHTMTVKNVRKML